MERFEDVLSGGVAVLDLGHPARWSTDWDHVAVDRLMTVRSHVVNVADGGVGRWTA